MKSHPAMEGVAGGSPGVRFEPHPGQRSNSKASRRRNSKGSDRPESQGSAILTEQLSSTTGGGGGGASGPSNTRSGVVPARHINTLRAYSDATRRKSVKMPSEGIMMRITNVLDIYRTVRVLVAMISNAWSWTFSSATTLRMVMPQLGRIHVGNKVFVVPGYLLPDLEPMCKGAELPSAPSHKSFSSPTVPEFHLKHPIESFPHVLVLLKLRFLLRLHSAGCEMDYKMCSFKTLIMGLQYVILQQHAAVETDSIFQSNVAQTHAGSHFSLESVVEDIFDQLQRALGGAWRPFLEFVFTCDPLRSVQSSKMESSTSPPKIASNSTLAVILDTIFLAYFLRISRKDGDNNLRHLYDDLELLHMPLPQIPPLQDAQHLRAWAKAQSRPTRQDRERVSGKDYEKLAQLDAVLLTSAVELHLPEVIASPEEQSESTVNNAVSGTLGATEIAPDPVAFGGSDKPPGSAGPKAARVILVDKPQLSPVLFDAAMHCIHHHATFPDGIRERLYDVLSEEYGITQEQSQRLAIAVTQNIDGNRLPESVLLGMEHREKVRLRNYQSATNRDTSHLLVAPLVACPIEKGRPPKYTLGPPAPTSPLQRTASSVVGGRDLERTGSAPGFLGRDPFKVPMQPGPLVMDPDTGSLKTTGFFFKTTSL